MNGPQLIDDYHIMGIHYLSGSVDSPHDRTVALMAAEASLPSTSSKKSFPDSITGVLVGVAVLAIVGGALLLKKRQVSDIQHMEDYEMEEQSIANDWDTRLCEGLEVSDDCTAFSCVTSPSTSIWSPTTNRSPPPKKQEVQFVKSSSKRQYEVTGTDSIDCLYGSGRSLDVTCPEEAHVWPSSGDGSMALLSNDPRQQLAFDTSDILDDLHREVESRKERAYSTNNNVSM